MQGLCYTRRCIQFSRQRLPLQKSIPARRFASRRSPGFNASKPTGTHASSKDRASAFDATGPSTRPKEASREKSAKEINNEKVPLIKRFRPGPGKLIIFSIVAFVSYKLYTWQPNLEKYAILNPRIWSPFILESREEISSTNAILNLLSLPKGLNTEIVSEAWNKGAWSVEVVQPELQVARSYTPLPPIEGAEPEQVRLLVRQEPQGEVSTYLHKINRGTIVHLRGPRIEYEIPEDVDEILFLAGGTGIAPALQVAHSLFNHRTKLTEKGPELRILWANRRREDSINGLGAASQQRAGPELTLSIQKLADKGQGQSSAQPEKTDEEKPPASQSLQTRLVEEVESLKARHGGKVIVDYFIDEEESYISESLLSTYLKGIDQTTNQDGTPRRKIILVSGPEGFVNAFAGPKRWQGGREIQGPLGGILKKIDAPEWEIWKL